MRQVAVFLYLFCSSICFSQTDSMFVEKMDGTIRGYPISIIKDLTFSKLTDVQEAQNIQDILSSFVLQQNYPNPFNPSTTIQYSIPKTGVVVINIYDVQGRVVRSLDNTAQQAGNHSIVWDSKNNNGSIVSSGTYYCQVLYNQSYLVKKLILVK